MNIPGALASALETLLAEANSADLSRAAQRLTERYQAGQASSAAGALTPDEALAYAAVRMPATYGAVSAAMDHLARQWPTFQPTTLLDVGAGPGTALWAAHAAFPSIERITALEREPAMRILAQRLGTLAQVPWLRHVTWLPQDIAKTAVHDYALVVAAYVLNELSFRDAWRVTDELWRHTEGALLLIEPGTPAGFERLRELRLRLLAAGAHVLAPCPHDDVCPMAGGDWCHFAERVSRSRRHRQLKGGDAPFEDEKYSYVAVSRQVPAARPARILRHPRSDPGRIQLTLCAPEGLSAETVTKKTAEPFRRARKARWGDTWTDR